MGEGGLRQDFETLTLNYLDCLYSFALILTRERDRAEDLVQETYLRAYRFYDRYECGTNYKAWLFTMMRNIFINGFHQRAKEISLSDMDDVEECNDDGYESPNDTFFLTKLSIFSTLKLDHAGVLTHANPPAPSCRT